MQADAPRGAKDGSGLHRAVAATLALACVTVCALAVSIVPALATGRSLAQDLEAAAPKANPRVVELALRAMECAARRGQASTDVITVIDYSKPSTQPRLWVFDTRRRRLLYEELVAHGRNSGENYATAFSNRPGSRKTSIGLFRTTDTYQGHHGYSLRLEGLETGVNDNAEKRRIVVHGARYVDKSTAQEVGYLGRSWGCPAVRPSVARRLIDTIKSGRLVFAYYPDSRWLHGSPYLTCG